MHPARAIGFKWDEECEEHLSRHRITADEAEQVFLNGPVWAPNKKARRGIWKMVGWTDGGRALTIIVNMHDDENVLGVITGYDATASDVTRYLKKQRRRR